MHTTRESLVLARATRVSTHSFAAHAHRWEHESLRIAKQDGDCISLTVRLKSVDGYFSWDIPEKLKNEIDLANAGPREHREVGFARMMQHTRLKRDRPWA